MAARLKAGGLPAQDVQVLLPPGGPKKGNLVARYRGTGARKPLMLLGHLDVVEAKRDDWQRDPFKLVEENGYFYARGTADDKAMVAVFIANLIRYRQEGYRPDRDLILVATCDEEIVPSSFSGIVYLLKNHRDLVDAEFALNEGGNGLLDKNGRYLSMTIQAGEKVFQTDQLEVTNPGGHSSLPVRDNAIYHLDGGLARIAGPVEAVSSQMWPGVPVVPTLLAGATDGRFTINAGIPTYGVNGMFRDPDGGGVHGLNERIRVRSLYEGHEFLYRLVRLYAGGN